MLLSKQHISLWRDERYSPPFSVTPDKPDVYVLRHPSYIQCGARHTSDPATSRTTYYSNFIPLCLSKYTLPLDNWHELRCNWHKMRCKRIRCGVRYRPLCTFQIHHFVCCVPTGLQRDGFRCHKNENF